MVHQLGIKESSKSPFKCRFVHRGIFKNMTKAINGFFPGNMHMQIDARFIYNDRVLTPGV